MNPKIIPVMPNKRYPKDADNILPPVITVRPAVFFENLNFSSNQ